MAGSTPPVNEWTFYGANGEKLGVYQLAQGTDNYGNAYAFFAPVRTSVWFGGKLVYENGPVNLDRLGTNHAQSAQFLPYGDEITSTSNDRTKFGTYTRDSYTGLDYADQRYYASTYGRFTSPDPFGPSANPSNPETWDRYAYAGGDPINLWDQTGEAWCSGLSSCVGQGLQVAGGVAGVVGGVWLITGIATPVLTAGAGAWAGVAVIGGTGGIVGGGLIALGGITGSNALTNAGTTVTTVTNLAGYVGTVGSSLIGIRVPRLGITPSTSLKIGGIVSSISNVFNAVRRGASLVTSGTASDFLLTASTLTNPSTVSTGDVSTESVSSTITYDGPVESVTSTITYEGWEDATNAESAWGQSAPGQDCSFGDTPCN